MRTTIANASARIKGTLIAAVALSLVLTSTTMAGTGVGAVFNLGQTNAVNARSILTGSANAPLLQVGNSNTGANAGSIAAFSRGATAPTLRAQNNSGTGAALGLFTANNAPPLTVNSTGKVIDLNADLLDGRDASQFMLTNTFRVEAPTDAGELKSDGTFGKTASCPANSVLLSGGPASIDKTSTVLDNFATSTANTWFVRINANGANDHWTVVVLCAARSN